MSLASSRSEGYLLDPTKACFGQPIPLGSNHIQQPIPQLRKVRRPFLLARTKKSRSRASINPLPGFSGVAQRPWMNTTSTRSCSLFSEISLIVAKSSPLLWTGYEMGNGMQIA